MTVARRLFREYVSRQSGETAGIQSRQHRFLLQQAPQFFLVGCFARRGEHDLAARLLKATQGGMPPASEGSWCDKDSLWHISVSGVHCRKGSPFLATIRFGNPSVAISP
jgi:hypothetical protein